MFTAKHHFVKSATKLSTIAMMLLAFNLSIQAQTVDDINVFEPTGEEETDPDTDPVGGGANPPSGKRALQQYIKTTDNHGHVWVISSFHGQVSLSEEVTLKSSNRDFYIAEYNEARGLLNHYHLSGHGIESITHFYAEASRLVIGGKQRIAPVSREEKVFIAAIHETGVVQWVKRLEKSGGLTLEGISANEWEETEVQMSATTREKVEWIESTTRYYTVRYDADGEMLQMEAMRNRR